MAVANATLSSQMIEEGTEKHHGDGAAAAHEYFRRTQQATTRCAKNQALMPANFLLLFTKDQRCRKVSTNMYLWVILSSCDLVVLVILNVCKLLPDVCRHISESERLS